uniref:Uncharacterized protein n=1 Tax=Glossina palpalis gambiensis TaxID=67801 RepID=A0A1B0C4J6_9MUSC
MKRVRTSSELLFLDTNCNSSPSMVSLISTIASITFCCSPASPFVFTTLLCSFSWRDNDGVVLLDSSELLITGPISSFIALLLSHVKTKYQLTNHDDFTFKKTTFNYSNNSLLPAQKQARQQYALQDTSEMLLTSI